MPKVSVIVPVYKVEKYLDRCVSSITGQTLKDIEIILVDDGSPDNSGAMCDEWAAKDGRIKVIHKANAGAGLARDSGLEIATGEYIGFVDSDDYIALDMFETLYSKAVSHNAQVVIMGYCFVGGSIIAKEDSVESVSYFDKETVFSGKDGVDHVLLNICGSLPGDQRDSNYDFGCCNKLFLRKVITDNDVHYQSERVVTDEDVLFALDCIKHTDCIVGIEGAYYYYCRNGESLSKSYQNDRFVKNCQIHKKMQAMLSERMPESKYKIYLDRLLESYARVACMQEIMFKDKNKLTRAQLNRRLLDIIEYEPLTEVLKTYPIWQLPKTQTAFAITMKYKMPALMKLLVRLKGM